MKFASIGSASWVRAMLALACNLLARAPASAAHPAELAPALQGIRDAHGVPALAAAAVLDGTLKSRGAVGVRSSQSKESVTEEDRWHVGSCTKSMTSTLAALLVEKGTLRWDSTVEECLPDIPMDAIWRRTTLVELLTHRAGAPIDPPTALWREAWRRSGSPMQQRTAFVSGLLREAPASLLRGRFHYSNQGYAIAGAMLERAARRPWEELLRTHLFEPLGLSSAGFGPPCSAQFPRQPLGHTWVRGALKPVAPGPDADNPPAIAPAGAVHLSIGDFARYAAFHAYGTPGLPLSDYNFQLLHTPSQGAYAPGWRVLERSWAHGTVLTHAGSNTMFFAVMWVAPARGFAAVAACNSAGPPAEQACEAAIQLLVQAHLRPAAAQPPPNP